MKISVFSMHENLNKSNFMFTNNDTSIGDDLLVPLKRLKEYSEKYEVFFGTPDIISFENSDAILFIDYPTTATEILAKAIKANVPLFLLAIESPLVNQDNNNKRKHGIFKKIFTWNDFLVSENKEKYKKINYSFDLPRTIECSLDYKSRKLCTMIAGNKLTSYPGELYSKRIEIIEWFEKNHPNEFDLYGIDWDMLPYYIDGNKRIINKMPFIRKIFYKKYTTYKGRVERKREVLSKYNFSICFENIFGESGYITEKIFDCFFSGCIPIYLGAKNIEEYIPDCCFVDARRFKNTLDIYNYISSLTEMQIYKIRESISDFIGSSRSEVFSCNNFVRVVFENILDKDLRKTSANVVTI